MSLDVVLLDLNDKLCTKIVVRTKFVACSLILTLIYVNDYSVLMFRLKFPSREGVPSYRSGSHLLLYLLHLLAGLPCLCFAEGDSPSTKNPSVQNHYLLVELLCCSSVIRENTLELENFPLLFLVDILFHLDGADTTNSVEDKVEEILRI